MHREIERYGTVQPFYSRELSAFAEPEHIVVDEQMPIVILHLEDDADDAALAEALIHRGGVSCTIHRVVDREQFTAALESGTVDIILSDMSLPRFSGMEALAFAHAQYPSIPFIFLSGNMGEETAIETLLHGACDYVLKQRMQRLLPAILRVVKEAQESRKREQAEAEVRRMQEWATRVSDIISRSPIVAFSWTPEPGWPVRFVSENIQQFGYTADEFLQEGLLYADIIHPDDRHRVEEALRQLVATDQTETTSEYRILHKNGSVRWVEDHTKVLRDDDGTIVIADGVIVDITERKLHEIQQRLNASRMQTLYELASIESIEETTLIETVLERAVELTGSRIGYVHILDVNSACITKSYWTKNVPIECRTLRSGSACLDREILWQECISTQEPKQWSCTEHSGLTCPVHTDAIPVCSRHAVVPVLDNGAVVLIAGVGESSDEYNDSDIRMLQLMMIEMWRSLKRVRENMELKKLSRAVEHSPASILITDVQGNIEYVNPRLETMTGYASDELIGRHVRIFRSGAQDDDFYEGLWSIILAGEMWRGTIQNRKKDDTLYWESLVIAPIADNKGEIINFVAVKEDVSERIELEQSLITARSEAERAAKLKDQFIALISHEIRTPLNVIFGYSGLIREEYSQLIQPLDQYMFEAIEDAGKRLMRTVDLLLAASSLGSGAYSPLIEEFEARSTLERLLQQYYHTAHQKDLYLECHCHAHEVFLRLDRLGFEQAIQNLVDNALKFTKSGGVSITTSEQGNELRIDIRDTGPGMSKEFVAQVFHPFTQESEGYSRLYEGLGLGLALVKQYIEINGGRISVQTQIGNGSVFVVYFPLPT
jgi:two-component system, sensor histidine kinase and response regulator